MTFPSPNSRPWTEIVGLYANFLDRPWGAAMHNLVTRVNELGYVAAGLRGATSMADLFLGTSTDVLNNPRLKIQPTNNKILVQYLDGSPVPWNIEVGFDELPDRIERLLVKRLRWFRNSAIINRQPSLQNDIELNEESRTKR